MSANYYEILGISIDATDDQIRKAYRLNAIKYHPDKHFGDPFFTENFLSIKEAYENLIDPEKRAEFDTMFRATFVTTASSSATGSSSAGTGPHSQNNRQEQEEKNNEQFRYDPHKPFYSRYDREQQETPQHQPIRTPWGDDLADHLVFFSFPKRIGKLIGGFSTLVKGVKKKSFFRLLLFAIADSYIVIPIVAVLLFLLWNNWHNNLHQAGSTQRALIIFGVISAIVIGFKVMIYSNAVAFNHLNYFIGINGFAVYHCGGSVDNITYEKEVNFSDVTDLAVRYVEKRKGLQYEETEFHFYWLNTPKKEIVFEQSGSYRDQNNNPPRHLNSRYWMNKEAEKYWTVYLLDKMESVLQEKGYLEFKLYSPAQNLYSPYIRLGIGYITFLKGPDSFTYKFNEIKRVYTKKGELFIEHKNFEKKLFFFSSGNQNSIPLAEICNRQFFFRAMELLLGYSL